MFTALKYMHDTILYYHCVCVYMYIDMGTYMYPYPYTYTYICTYIYIYIYIYVYIYKSIYVHIYGYTYTHVDIHTHTCTLSAARCFRSTDYCASYGRHIQPLVTLGTVGRWVTRVTQLYDEIYVVCRGSPSILVYKVQEPFSRLDDVVVKEMKEPWDIAACWIARCLYVSDDKEICVWRVKICFGGEMLVDKFIERVVAWSVSVLTDGHVAVVAYRGDIATRGIFVYSPDGETTTAIDLKGYGLQQPTYAVQTSTGSWLVANGYNDAALHCIYELTADGHILDKYGGQCGSGDGQLNRPWRLALSDDGKQILVADSDNRRVLMLDRQPMRLKRILLETGGYTFGLYFVRPTEIGRAHV